MHGYQFHWNYKLDNAINVTALVNSKLQFLTFIAEHEKFNTGVYGESFLLLTNQLTIEVQSAAIYNYILLKVQSAFYYSLFVSLLLFQ